MEEENGTVEAPSIDEVLDELKSALAEVDGRVERVVVEHATDVQYMARVYLFGEEDFEGVILTFD